MLMTHKSDDLQTTFNKFLEALKLFGPTTAQPGDYRGAIPTSSLFQHPAANYHHRRQRGGICAKFFYIWMVLKLKRSLKKVIAEQRMSLQQQRPFNAPSPLDSEGPELAFRVTYW
ncbi:hypothetical protein ElyMa_002771300 [Elysia marginata]|uniref:Uncharacterized protein n=1 Tax=Elysia marginata TaxID=1093978 RepID=A0AAV4HP85_9GAST|nr:hypothetical protein ElyMa_002771300 [Elysia marginata]